METIQIKLTPKAQAFIIIALIIIGGLFLYAGGYEEGYTKGFLDAVEICSTIEGACI